MNDSERLLEVLDTCEGIIRNLGYTYDDIVDYLIANGVTVQKHGRWVGIWDMVCSECGRYAECIYDYCPNCGADMRESNNG